MAKLGILFAGQGAQHPGIGIAWTTQDSNVKTRIAKVSANLGFDLAAVCAGTDGRLDDTLYAQPAIVVASHLAWDALKRATGVKPAAFAGFSLGEWTALAAAGIFPCDHVLLLVKKRAEAMKAAAEATPGSMCAVLGLDADTVDGICLAQSTATATVVAANFNCPGQTVISGTTAAVARAAEAARSAGAKRIVPLNVSGGFHSPLMRSAADKMTSLLASEEPSAWSTPVWSNVTAMPHGIGTLKTLLAQQIVTPVRFETTIRNMIASGITHFLEIGPGTTLTGFVKKIAPELPVAHLDGPEDLGGVKGWLHEHGLIE